MEGLIIKQVKPWTLEDGRVLVDYERDGKSYEARVETSRTNDPRKLRDAVAEKEAQRSGEDWISPESWLTQSALSEILGVSRWQVPEYARKGWLRRQAPASGNTGYVYALHDWARASELKASTRVDLLKRQAAAAGALGVEAAASPQLDLTKKQDVAAAASPAAAAQPRVSEREAEIIRLFRAQKRADITPTLAGRLVEAADVVGFTPLKALSFVEERLIDFANRPKKYEIGALVAFIEQDLRAVSRPKTQPQPQAPNEAVKVPSDSWTAIRSLFGVLREGQHKIAKMEPRDVVEYLDSRRATYRVTSALYTPIGAAVATASIYDVSVALKDGEKTVPTREIERAYLYRCAVERARVSPDWPEDEQRRETIRKLILRLVDEWQG